MKAIWFIILALFSKGKETPASFSKSYDPKK